MGPTVEKDLGEELDSSGLQELEIGHGDLSCGTMATAGGCAHGMKP